MVQSLKDFELFAKLSDELDARYAAQCVTRKFEPNEIVVDFEDETQDVHLIVSGTVRIIYRITTGREIILNAARDGMIFGEIAAIDGLPRSANVTVIQPARIATLSRAAFLEILQQSPEVSYDVMLLLVGRIRLLTTKIAENSFLHLKFRLYNELMRMARPRAGHEGEWIVSPPPTQLELAERIGCRRESVSLEIGRMRREGLVEKLRGGLVLKDVGELNRRVMAGWEETG
ncbi:MAG: Crp/Fnr family transcriptional regulator [Rhodobiaceae bacterium]|nr:Crp/Fnr family transcriptional regulator [Rhodobiaceae bacterium]